MRLTFDVKSAKIVRKGLEELQKQIPDISRRRIYNAMLAIKKKMKPYPPVPSGSTYQRTGRLGRSWWIERVGDSKYRIGNRARHPRYRQRYAKWVVGNAFGQRQIAKHRRTGWLLFRNIADEEIAKLPPEVAKEIHTVARRNGFSPGV